MDSLIPFHWNQVLIITNPRYSYTVEHLLIDGGLAIRSLKKLITNLIFVSLSLFILPRYTSAYNGNWEGLAWLVFGFYTFIQIIATAIYLTLLKRMKKYDSARYMLHSIFAIVGLFYVYVLAGKRGTLVQMQIFIDN